VVAARLETTSQIINIPTFPVIVEGFTDAGA
jgi:hypothetical protein